MIYTENKCRNLAPAGYPLAIPFRSPKANKNEIPLH